MSRLEFTLRISLPWLVSAVSAVAVALLTFQLGPTAEWERVLHGEGPGPRTGQESEDLNEDGGHGVRCRGGGAATPPDFGGKFFNIFPPHPILAGFVVKCFNSIIKFLELRE